MTDPIASAETDFVALSLLPIKLWRDIGERLRAGEPVGAVLDRLLT